MTDTFSHGHRALIVEDAVFDRGPLSHAVSLFEMDQKYADVVSSDFALAYLRGQTRPSISDLEARP